MLNPFNACQLNVKRIWRKGKTELLDWIFPAKCLNCQEIGSWLCINCKIKLLQLRPIRRIINKQQFWAFANYREKSIQRLINNLKYSGITDLAEIAAELLAILFSTYLNQEIDLVTAIPLHRKRQAERTFNQATLIGQSLAAKLELEFAEVLIRTRYTPSQTNLSDQDRQQNVKGIFSLKEESAKRIIGSKILLIDDVVTSGATMSEAIKVLEQNGAQKVICLTLASR